MKNVAIIVQNLTGGGAERMAANMSIELQKKYNVYLVVFSAKSITYPYGGTLVDLNIPPIKGKSLYKAISNTIRRTIVLRKFKKKYNIDCSISHMEGASIVSILSRHRDKIISVYHTMPQPEQVKKIAYKLMQRYIGKYSDKFITVSKAAEKAVVEMLGVEKEKAQCIYNFSNISSISTLAKIDIESDAAKDFYGKHSRILINMGSLSVPKAQCNLIRAFSEVKKKHPESGLVILGDGEKRGAIQKVIINMGLENDVYIPGDVSNPFPYLKKADIFVLSSIYEGLPMVLIEAACCGCVIVSTDMRSGAREILAPDTEIDKIAKEKEYAQYGILVPVSPYREEGEISENEKILADAICEVLEDDKLCENYLNRINGCTVRFSPETIIPEWEKLIDM